jgi:hypothetical protein
VRVPLRRGFAAETNPDWFRPLVRSLRRVALGRKNYLLVGDVDAGMSIAGLYTLVATDASA